MIRLVLKAALFAVFFLVEVEVQAGERTFPDGCFFESSGCILSNSGSHWLQVLSANVRLDLAPGAVLQRKASDHIRLIEGQAIVTNRRDQDLSISFPAGSLVLPAAGDEVLLQVSPRAVQVQAPLHKVLWRAGTAFYELEPGFMVEADLTRLPAAWSVPRAMDLSAVLEAREQAGRDEAPAVKSHWVQASRVSAELSQKLVARTLASERAQQEREKQLQQRRQKELERARALFRRKNHLDLL